jgi:hypothetical protein
MTQPDLFTERRNPFSGACTFDPYIAQVDTSDGVCAALERAALDIVRRAGEITADDLHGVVDLQGRDPRVIGAVLRNMAQSGLVKSVGYVNSRRPECHHRPIRLFKLAGAI